MRKFSLVIAALFLFISGVVNAQTIKVSGTVTEAGVAETMPFVSVHVKGTTTSTTTLNDGTYVINAPANGTLVFTFMGFRTLEVPVENRTVINVQMEYDAVALGEVIMVAYGTAKRESITGSIASVNTQAIERRPVSSVSGVLEGQAAGVQVNNTYGEPGSDASIRIRGFSSVNASNSPLIVVDGVPFGGNISDMNPHDIESISVLKDAASAALFGNRASNGVILIATKRGKSEKTSVRANISQGIYNRGMAEYDKLEAKDFMEVMWTGMRNQLMLSQPDKYPNALLAGAEASANLIDTYLKYNIFNKPNNALFDANGKLVSDAKILPGYTDLDWFKPMERLGYRQDYVVSGDAASEKSTYFFSLGYLDEKGYVKSSDFQRYTGRTNITVTPKSWMKAGFSLSGSHQVSNSTTGDADSHTTIKNPFYFARNIAPIYPVYLHDMATGDFILDEDGNRQYDGGFLHSRPQLLDRHAIWESELNMDKTFRNTLGSQAFVDIDFLKDFKFVVKADVSLRNTENQTYDNASIGDGKGNKGRASRTWYRYKNYTFQQQLMYNKEFGMHNLDFLLGHENYSWNRSYHNGYKTTETFQGGTELINFTEITRLTGYQDNYKLESYLSRVRYNYDNKYFGEASFRRDGSSRFHPDNRWGNFWSLGGSWTISKEPFMAPYLNTINVLKLRASYGEVGNDAGVGYYGYMALYGMQQNANLGASYKTQNEAKEIQWETSSSFGVALEGSLYDRANFTVEYFDKRSQNLLFDVNLPLSAGATSTSSAEATITKNIGSVSNRGIEFVFDVDVVRNRDLKWNVGLNLTHFKNKIVKLPEENRENGILSGTKRYVEGRGIYDFWMFKFEGVDQMTGNSLYRPDFDRFFAGDPEDGKTAIPAEYLVQIGDNYYTTHTTYAGRDWGGSAIPDLFGSISTSLKYKNFDLNVLCTYSLGGKTLDNSYRSLMAVSANPSALHKDLLKAWNGIPAGMEIDSPNRINPNGIPVINYDLSNLNDASSTRFLQDASYFVIKNVSLSYTFPKKTLKKIDLSALSVNLSVDNLATITSLKGMNPQQSYSGINNNAFVVARVFSLGVNVRL